MVEFLIGIVLGGIFFGGLYWTVQRLDGIQNPSALFLVSFVVRMAILVAGLYYVSGSGYQAVLLTLLGILVIRYIMIFVINKPQDRLPKKDSPNSGQRL